MNILEMFSTDQSLEQDGIALEYGDTPKGPTTIVIARAGGANKKFDACIQRLIRPHRQAISRGRFPVERQEALTRKAVIETVVLAWENMPNPNGDGTYLDFTTSNVELLFEALPDLLSDVVEQAGAVSNFIAEVRTEDAKS